jgi:hypothetical protein
MYIYLSLCLSLFSRVTFLFISNRWFPLRMSNRRVRRGVHVVQGEKLYCICRRPYDEREFMIGCDGCGNWYVSPDHTAPLLHSRLFPLYSCPCHPAPF